MGKEEAEYASELLGDTTVKTSSLHRGRNGLSDSVSYTRRRLMTPDEIRRMRWSQLLVIASNVAGMKLRSKPYYRSRHLRRLAELVPVSSPTMKANQAGCARLALAWIQKLWAAWCNQGQVKP